MNRRGDELDAASVLFWGGIVAFLFFGSLGGVIYLIKSVISLIGG